MKQIIISFLLLLMAVGCRGQGDNLSCARNYSLYKEFMNVGSYDLAVEPYWELVNECPAFRKGLYADGVKIYVEFIMKADDSTRAYPLLDTIKSLYDRQVRCFGDKCGASHYYVYWLLRLRQRGKLSLYKLFDELMPCIEYLSDTSCLSTTRATLEAYFSKSDAELMLVNRMAESKYNKPGNLDECHRLIRIMDLLGASKNSLYLYCKEKVFESGPSYKDAASIGGLCMEMGLGAKAMEYYRDAVRLAKVSEDSNPAGPDRGRGYLAIAGIYLACAGSFGLDSFGASEVYWVAADYAAKAHQNPDIAAQADKILAECKARFPRKDEAFMHSVKPGDRVEVKLFGTEYTIARF